MRDPCFEMVYRVLVLGESLDLGPGQALECIQTASDNKVLLGFLRALDLGGRVRSIEEARYTGFLKNLQIISEALEGLNHAFIKLRKPVVYVPADIDILVDRGDIARAVGRLQRIGFRIAVREPYTVTMTRGNSIVDLYTNPTVGGVIYARGSKLLEYIEKTRIEGIEIPTLQREAEAVLTAAHAVYKERIYTLNDHITIRRWLNRRAYRIAEELECHEALNHTIRISEKVERREEQLPHRIPLITWIQKILTKTIRDNTTASTLPNIAKKLKNPRIGREIISRITRNTY